MNKKKGLIFLLFFSMMLVLSGIADVSSKVLDCGSDLDCFIENSQDCTASKFKTSNTFNFFGMDLGIKITSNFLFKMRPYKSNCEFYINNQKVTVRLSEELKQTMRDEGLTEKEITKMERIANRDAKLFKGVKICRFNNEDLTSALTNFKEGYFSSDDFKNAECKGNEFI